jgi:outer membrane protein OmpA-like peptidoglycan-associated protein
MKFRPLTFALLVGVAAPASADSGMVNINGDLGIAAPITGPWGTQLTTNPGPAQAYGPQLQLAVDWQFFAPLAVELALGGGFQVTTPTIEWVEGTTGRSWTYGLVPHVSASVGPRLRFLDDPDGGNLWTSAHVGGHWFDGPQLGVDLGVGYQFGTVDRFQVGPFARGELLFDFGPRFDHSFIVTVGVATTFDVLPYDRTPPPPPDADGDGIPDGSDGAPNAAEDKDAFQDEDGVPDPDNDGDGVLDGADKCPVEAGPPENGGCPILDKDGDGVPDANDAMPDVPEDKDGFQDEDGAPDPDNDKDGVNDVDDQCPMEPGVVEEKGCPIKDADADGVPDRADNCQTEAGPKDNQGCPKAKKQLVIVTRESIDILQKVYFDTGKATIQKRSFALLDQVAGVVKDKTWIKKVRIEGHTDDQGDNAKNQQLSQARAESVRDYLVKAGVDAARLEAIGFGEDQPVATNKTSAGRAENRRVVFKVTETE